MNTNNEVTQEDWNNIDEINRIIDEQSKKTSEKVKKRIAYRREKLKYLSAFLDRLLIGNIKTEEIKLEKAIINNWEEYKEEYNSYNEFIKDMQDFFNRSDKYFDIKESITDSKEKKKEFLELLILDEKFHTILYFGEENNPVANRLKRRREREEKEAHENKLHIKTIRAIEGFINKIKNILGFD